MEKIKLVVTGMHCTNCAGNLDKKINEIAGVQKVTVNFALGVLTAQYALPATEAQIQKAIEELGFKYAQAQLEKQQSISRVKLVQLVVAIVLTIPLVLAMSEHMFGVKVAMPEFLVSHSSQFVLATIVQFGCGLSFYKEAWASWRSKMLDMATLVVLGTTAAYLLSIYNTFVLHTMGYFESSAMIISFVLIGKYLESLSKYKAGAALQTLISQQPTQATVLGDGDVHLEMDIAELVVGMRVLVKANDKIPVDGEIIRGETAVDESTLTGESLPADKKVGDQVFAGTQNTYGTIVIRTVHAGEDTVFASILTTLENAQTRKAPIQRLADKIAAVFVPGIITVSVLTFLVWYFLLTPGVFATSAVYAIAVMVIACPCALGLATPISILVSTGRAAKFGILYKGGAELEKTAHINAVVFDKTGTLTLGLPKVQEVKYFNSYDAQQALAPIAATEQLSEHPLAKSIVNFAGRDNLPTAENFTSLQGKGATAEVNGYRLIVGSAKLLRELEVDTSQGDEFAVQAQKLGMTVIYASMDGVLAAIFAVTDTIRDTAYDTVSKLKAGGKRVYLLTGDNMDSAAYIAAQVGIERIRAGVLPQEKSEFIRDLQAQGLKVAMVGDGVNDALALAQADLAISLAGANALAVDTSDIMLMNKDIASAVMALRLGEATFKNIKQNLFFALVYNVIAIPLAVSGSLSPELAGFCMSLSSVSVVLNALRLRSFH